MAENDYFVIMYRVMATIYGRMQNGLDFDPDVLSYKKLGIPESYFSEIIISMMEKGYIKGVAAVPVDASQEYIKWRIIWIDPKITMDGVQFLEENSMMNKVRNYWRKYLET